MITTTFDKQMERIESGERLSSGEIAELSTTPDILPLGMLADAWRRRVRGARVTYLRVASRAFDAPSDEGVPVLLAREIHLTGTPETSEAAVAAITSARATADNRTVAAFSWRDVERLAGNRSDRVPHLLRHWHDAGLDAFAELPLDGMSDPPMAIEALRLAGFERLRLTVDGANAAGRPPLWLLASELQDRFDCIQVLNPLPSALRAFRPTTGYEDVKMVALARLAAPNIPMIQVDWLRYGPKLAQVALTFGADDVTGISASDDSPEGRRRAPLEEIRRNVEAAGFKPVERDGRFAVLS